MVNSQGIYEALKKLFVTDKDGHIIVDSIGTWEAVDITDDWTRQLGLVDLSRVLGAALAHTNPVIVRISDGTSAYLNPQTIRALTSTDVVTADSLTKWGGTALSGRDITGDLALLQPASAIGTLADVTAAASATQLIVASTACKAVIVRSLAANTSTIRVGDSNVSASRGAELSKGDAIILAVDNVNKVYVYGNASDKVSIAYVS